MWFCSVFFFFQAEDGIRDLTVTGVQTCALPISLAGHPGKCRDAARRTHSVPDCGIPDARGVARGPAAGRRRGCGLRGSGRAVLGSARGRRSEEHTSELQSQSNLVCRLLLEKKKQIE